MILIMSCFLTGAMIQHQVVAPPNIHLALGSVQIVAYRTSRPDCPPFGGRKPPGGVLCSTDSLFASEETYTIWLLLPGRSSPAGLPRTTFRRLVLLSIE